MEVGGGEGEYVSLDVEAWEDFLESRFKRLSVVVDPDTLSSNNDRRQAEAKGVAAAATAAATVAAVKEGDKDAKKTRLQEEEDEEQEEGGGGGGQQVEKKSETVDETEPQGAMNEASAAVEEAGVNVAVVVPDATVGSGQAEGVAEGGGRGVTDERGEADISEASEKLEAEPTLGTVQGTVQRTGVGVTTTEAVSRGDEDGNEESLNDAGSEVAVAAVAVEVDGGVDDGVGETLEDKVGVQEEDGGLAISTESGSVCLSPAPDGGYEKEEEHEGFRKDVALVALTRSGEGEEESPVGDAAALDAVRAVAAGSEGQKGKGGGDEERGGEKEVEVEEVEEEESIFSKMQGLKERIGRVASGDSGRLALVGGTTDKAAGWGGGGGGGASSSLLTRGGTAAVLADDHDDGDGGAGLGWVKSDDDEDGDGSVAALGGSSSDGEEEGGGAAVEGKEVDSDGGGTAGIILLFIIHVVYIDVNR